MPESHDGTQFTFEVAFSEAVTASAEDLRDHAFDVTGATITQVTQVDDRLDLWTLTVSPASSSGDITVELEGARSCDVAGAICTEEGEQLSETVSVEIAGTDDQTVALTALFQNVPAGHNGTAFNVQVKFNKEIVNTEADFRDNAFTVNGGEVTDADKVGGDAALWEVEITPGGQGNITIALRTGLACGTPGALCTSQRQTLGLTPLAIVAFDPNAIQTPDPNELTAWFSDMPAEHDAEEEVSFNLEFSHEIYNGNESVDKNRAVRSALDVTGGTVRSVHRPVRTEFDAFRIRIRPGGMGNITVRLDPPGGACTASDRRVHPGRGEARGGDRGHHQGTALDLGRERDRGGGPGRGARVRGDPGARSLLAPSPSSTRPSNGSAKAGEDYTSTSGTLSLQPRRGHRRRSTSRYLTMTTTRTAETMTLTLSEATGGYIADGQATGTITNTDAHARRVELAVRSYRRASRSSRPPGTGSRSLARADRDTHVAIAGLSPWHETRCPRVEGPDPAQARPTGMSATSGDPGPEPEVAGPSRQPRPPHRKLVLSRGGKRRRGNPGCMG